MASAPSLIAPSSAIAAAMLLFAAAGAQADWAEVGDAGALPGTAQSVTGGGPLTNITGTLASADADMFAVFILGAFTATTVGTTGTVSDTQLFLFDSAGRGVLANDDASNLTSRSTISGTLAPGIYYLAITEFNLDPVSSGGAIFPGAFQGLHGPTGSGGASPITGWSASTPAGGTYQIDLAGVSIVPLPPAAFAGFSGLTGVIGFSVIRRRRLC
jgi:hypothetical protein